MFATAMVVGVATGASAHTALESTTPADGSTVDVPPAEVGLVFSQSLLGVTSVKVTAPDGTTVSTGAPTHDGPRVFQALGPLTTNGTHTTEYTVVATDGHELTGAISFTYTGALAPAGNTAIATASPSTAVSTNPDESESATDSASRAEGEDGGRDVSSVVIGSVIVLALLVGVFFLLRRLRRRG